MSEEFELSKLTGAVGDEQSALRNASVCSIRLLQWMSERLPIDRESSMMRGMASHEWENAYQLLIAAGVVDSNFVLLMSIPDALSRLRMVLASMPGDS